MADAYLRGLLIRRGHSFYRRYLKGTRLGRLVGKQILKYGLVSSTELQISALSQDGFALQGGAAFNALDVEAGSKLSGFHFSEPLNLVVSEALSARPAINVLLPSLCLKNMSGGPNTALVVAAMLAERGEQVRLIACDAPAEGDKTVLYPHMEALLRRPVARERIELVDAFDRNSPTAIGVNDLFFATAWWTAQIAKYAVAKTVCKTFIYLIQDFEPILHEGSTFQARALETYSLPHVPIINTRLLLDHLVKEGGSRYTDPSFVASALCFEPALDRRYYFPDEVKAERSSKKVLLFYARPNVAHRNLFELGVVALRQAVASGAIDRDNWEVWAMGETLEPVALGNGVFLNPLPWLCFEDYAKRVRTADLMLSLMLSPHPSYPPLEMAASGKIVVTNGFSVKTAERLRALSANILVAEPTAESVGKTLINAAGRVNAGMLSYDPSGTLSIPSNWDECMGEIVPALLQRIHELRTQLPDAGTAPVAGYPAVPTTEYERYRIARLACRRSEDEYRQEPGLLSFVTSAYNTDPVFLQELGHSIFQQDGGMQFEWLILDNGSTDEGTRNALGELAERPGVRLERVEQNLGIIGGMRYLLERATGRYILPLDSDDLLEPDCVHVITQSLKDNAYPALLYTDEDKLASGRFGSPYFKPDWDPVLFLHSCYIAHLCAIDRERALELGLYTDSRAEGCHDWDSFIRFMEAGYVPFHVPEVLYSWRIHEASTSGNIASKSYITDSHRATLQGVLDRRKASNLELVNSPLFNYNVDWWYRRKKEIPVSCVSVLLTAGGKNVRQGSGTQPLAVIEAEGENAINELATFVSGDQSELVHLYWHGVVEDDDEWRRDSAGLMEMFPDTVMVGGALHNGGKVISGPLIFGFGNGYGCPDQGRLLVDAGYSAIMWKARSVSAVSSGHCVVRRDFLLQAIETVPEGEISIYLLGPWLGALAAKAGKRVVYSPFMRAQAAEAPESLAPESAKALFLSRFWGLMSESRSYSKRLGLTHETAFSPVAGEDRDRHLRKLQLHTQPYHDWLARELQHRLARYPVPVRAASVTIVTPVYRGSDLKLLGELARAIGSQSHPVSEWLLVVNGPMPEESMAEVRAKCSNEWKARLIVEPEAIGIVAALRLGLEAAQSEYAIPVDADDLVTHDAIQILVHEIERQGQPDLLYSDEDLLIDGVPSKPYLRAAFDPVLSLENSVIWHLCAMKREFALSADVYGDVGANWCQDWDSVSRISAAGGRIVHVPEVLYHWRQHVGSTTNNAQGDPRSLDSVRHILERHIASVGGSGRFHVDEWPMNRGTRELYIARTANDLPKFIWIGDPIHSDLNHDKDAILVVAANGVFIDSTRPLLEAARLFDLHPSLGAIGGLVEGKDGVVVDGCYMVNGAGVLESPWIGYSIDHGGPYALAQKVQSVTTTGALVAFFRLSALRQAGAWPAESSYMPGMAARLCGDLVTNGWTIAFSPLVRARAGIGLRVLGARRRRPVGMSPSPSHGLIRYGLSRQYRD